MWAFRCSAAAPTGTASPDLPHPTDERYYTRGKDILRAKKKTKGPGSVNS